MFLETYNSNTNFQNDVDVQIFENFKPSIS